MSAEKAWSLLDNKPVLKYIPKCDDYIVYWNGIVMSHRIALSIGGTLLNIFPTPEMKQVLNQNYRTLYYADAFDSLGKWDKILEGSRGHKEKEMYSYLLRYMEQHLQTLKDQKIPGAEVLGWFEYSRAIS